MTFQLAEKPSELMAESEANDILMTPVALLYLSSPAPCTPDRRTNCVPFAHESTSRHDCTLTKSQQPAEKKEEEEEEEEEEKEGVGAKGLASISASHMALSWSIYADLRC
jgi:hypothetical protein